MRAGGVVGRVETMSDATCPSCGHTFSPSAPDRAEHGAPDLSVVRWYRTDTSWLGELSVDEVYAGYLRATDGVPVSRRRFVADLAYLGVEEVLDDDTRMLVRS